MINCGKLLSCDSFHLKSRSHFKFVLIFGCCPQASAWFHLPRISFFLDAIFHSGVCLCPQTSAFVMLIDKSTRVPARPLDLASTSGANVLYSADPQPLAASSSQSGKLRRHRLDLLEDYNPRPRKIFSEDSARIPKVVADLPVAMGSSSGAFADAILHDRIFLRRPSPARVGSARDANSSPAAAFRVPRLTTAPSSAS